jgi:four helix bundle protein
MGTGSALRGTGSALRDTGSAFGLHVSRHLLINNWEMSSYRDLEIYNLSKMLAIKIHKMSLKLPQIEMYEEASQIRRSSKAITASIVEGYGRSRYKAEFIKYLTYAHAECDETILHLEFLRETESLSDIELYSELLNSYDQLGRKINKFILWVDDEWNKGHTPNPQPVTRNP